MLPVWLAPLRLQDLRQAEVGQPDRAADEEDVVRLDVAVLDADQAAVAGRVAGLVEEVDGPGQLVHVAEQLVARQAGQPCSLALAEPVPQALVAQRHGDHQAVLHPDGELDVEQVGMADVADDLQRPLLRARPASVSRRMNFRATRTPPGASASQTSPNPPRPSSRTSG